MDILTKVLIIVVCWCGLVSSLEFDVPECGPPDFPLWGGYGPKQDSYVVGDVIHYYCDVDTYIGGNFLRRCEDTGDWTGETPVCDPSTNFTRSFQSSTRDPANENSADRAVDGRRGTCAVTESGRPSAWQGVLEERGELIRVMVFLPQNVEVAYEVILVRRDGGETSCGRKSGYISRLEWHFHNCPGPNNTDAVAIRIQTLSTAPLYICEVQAHVLVSPKCVDPHINIVDGRLQLTRRTAMLMCDKGFSRSRDTRINCIHDGVWTKKQLFCTGKQWEVIQAEPIFDP